MFIFRFIYFVYFSFRHDMEASHLQELFGLYFSSHTIFIFFLLFLSATIWITNHLQDLFDLHIISYTIFIFSFDFLRIFLFQTRYGILVACRNYHTSISYHFLSLLSRLISFVYSFRNEMNHWSPAGIVWFAFPITQSLFFTFDFSRLFLLQERYGISLSASLLLL